MADITVTILDGQLGLVNSVGQNAIVHAGVCAAGTPNAIYGLGDIPTASSTLGPGTLTENVADTIAVAGSCFACPVNPSVAGSVGSTTQVGTGAGTVTGSAGPAYQILAKISTGGVLGTMAVEFSVNGGAYSAPVVSTVSSWSYLVPGTLTTLTFSAQTYTAAAVWTITTAGVISLSGTGTVGWVTQVSSPLDTYNVLVAIATAGALGAAVFTYSVDGGNSQSANNIQVPGGGVYVIAGTGIILTFASTFVALDTYSFTTVTAGFTTTDVGNALNALGAGAQQWFGVHIAGMGSTSSAAASMSSTVDTSLSAMAVAFRYVMGIVECPQSEGDSTIETSFVNFASNRVMVTVTDILHQSSLNRGRAIRRNLGVAIASRLAATNPSQDPGWVGSPLGALQNVQAIFRDEAKTPGLAPARFTVATTRPTKAGYFCESGNMMAQAGSDFSSVGNRRVMDVGCGTAVGVLVNDLNADLLVKADGTIDDREATRLEGVVTGALTSVLLSPTPPDATAVNCSINRSAIILSTQILPVAVQIVPKGKVKAIALTIGYQL